MGSKSRSGNPADMKLAYIYHLICSILLFAPCIQAQDGVFGDVDAVEQVNPCNEFYEWQCADGSCIAKYDLCSGTSQCRDESDEAEANCPDSPGLVQQPKHEPLQPGRKVEIQPKHNVTTNQTPTTAANGWSLRFVAGGLFLVLGLAALVHFLLKKRKSRIAARNIRRGEKSLVEEEDDELLLYA